MPNYGSRLTSSMYIRGIGSRVNSPAVGIYEDGMPLMGKTAFNFHTYDLAYVDVLRGPQGTLYGLNTEGGLVRMYSPNPFHYQGTDVSLGWGTRFYRNAEVSNYTKFSDKVAMSIAGFYDGQNGFFRNQTTGGRADAYNEAGGKARLMYQPTRKLSFDFVADYQYVNQYGFPYGIIDPGTGETAQPSSNYQGSYRRNMLNTGLNMLFHANGFDFNSNTSYQYLNDNMLMDMDYLPEDFVHMTQYQLQNSVTQDFTFKSTNNSFWHWTTGVFGSYQWLKTDAPIYFGDAMTGALASTVQTAAYNGIVQSMVAKGMPQAAAEAMVNKAGGVSFDISMATPGLFHTPQFNLGFYHESNFDITSRLTATLGLRYDYTQEGIHYQTATYMTLNGSVMGAQATHLLSSTLNHYAHNNYNQLLPKFAVSYRIDNNQSNVYATVSKGYRAGGFNIQMFSDIMQVELMANSAKAQQSNYDIPHTSADYENMDKTIEFEPEVSWNYEVGTHLNLFGYRVHLDLAAYYMQIRNQQLSVMSNQYGFGRAMVNAGKSESCGVEVALQGVAMGDHLSWAVSYGYTRAVFKEYKDNTAVGGVSTPVDYKNNRVPYVPSNTFAATADYRMDFTSSVLRSVTIGANVTGQGKTYWDEANTYAQNLYAILGAHIDADFGKVTLGVWGKNLTDTKYNTFAVSSAATGTNYTFGQLGTPFQFGVDVKCHF